MQQPGESEPAPQGPTPEELADKDADRKSKEGIEKLKARTAIARDLINRAADKRDQRHQHKHEGKQAFMDVLMEMMGHQRDAAQFAAQKQERASQPQGLPAGM
jgi:hypothetical protein